MAENIIKFDIPKQFVREGDIDVPFPAERPQAQNPVFRFAVPPEMLTQSEKPDAMLLTCPANTKFKIHMNMGRSERTPEVSAETIKQNMTAYMEHGWGFTQDDIKPAQTQKSNNMARDTRDLDIAAGEIENAGQLDNSQQPDF